MKKRIAIVDPLSPKGHLDINKVTLELLKDEYDIYFFASENYKDIVPNEVKATFYPQEFFEIKSSPFKNRINHYKAFKMMLKDIGSINGFQCVIVMSYELISAAFLIKRINKISHNVFFLNHNNVDEAARHFIKRFFFKKIFKKACPIVYESFIGSFVDKKFNIKSRLVRHNLNIYKTLDVTESKKYNVRNNNTIVTSLSGNDLSDEIIHDLIRADESGLLQQNGIVFIIKNRKIDYKSSNLVLINEYLSNEEYNYLLSISNYKMLLYEDSYQYRVSGVYFDAVSFKKPIIYLNNRFFKDQEKRFGSLGIVFESVGGLIQDIKNADYKALEENVEKAFGYYSDDNVKEDFLTLINC